MEYRISRTVDWLALDGRMVRVRCLPEGLVLVLPEDADVVVIGRTINRRASRNGDTPDAVKPPMNPETWREGAGDTLLFAGSPMEGEAEQEEDSDG